MLVDLALLPDAPQAVLPDPSLDRYARMAQRVLRTPIALVTIVEEDRQVFPGATGLPPEVDSVRETPLPYSFCKHVVASNAPMVVTDARLDPRVADNPSIAEYGVLGYVGYPLTDADGRVIGSLCALDTVPRDWSAGDLAAIEDLAAACSTEIGLRELRRRAGASAQAAIDSTNRLRALLELTKRLAAAHTVDEIARVLLRVAVAELDCLHAGLWVVDPQDPSALRYVADPDIAWPQAERFDTVHFDDTTPLGVALRSNEVRDLADHTGSALDFPELDYTDVAEEGIARSFVPLSVDATPVGCLVVLWGENRSLTADDQVVIDVVAAAAAGALHRARSLGITG